MARAHVGGDIAAVPAPLHRLEARSVLDRHHQPAEASEGFAVRFVGEAVRSHEIREAFHADNQRNRKVRVGFGEQDPRQQRVGMMKRLAVGRRFAQ